MASISLSLCPAYSIPSSTRFHPRETCKRTRIASGTATRSCSIAQASPLLLTVTDRTQAVLDWPGSPKMAAVSPSSGPVAGSSQLASPLSSPHHSLRTLPTSPAKPQDREQQQPRPKKRRQQQQRRESPSVASTESRQHTQPLPIKQSKQEENEEGPDGPPRRPPLLSLSSKSKPIVGPDGQAYTPGEAARLGLTIRTACEACRSRKLKCSGNPPDKGGCERCRTDNVDCIYSELALAIAFAHSDLA